MSPAQRSRSLTRAVGSDLASGSLSQSGRRVSAEGWKCPQCHHWLSGAAVVCHLGCARACKRQFGCPLWMSETRMQSPRRQGGCFELLVAIVNPQPSLGSSLICRCALLATEAPSEWCEAMCGVVWGKGSRHWRTHLHVHESHRIYCSAGRAAAFICNSRDPMPPQRCSIKVRRRWLWISCRRETRKNVKEL